jgi:ribonuclease P protein component
MPPSARLPLARHRLRQADFARVYREGRRAQGAHLTVVLSANGLDRTRLGLSVSKKHARRAVDRNRSRRILREVFRTSLAELPAGLDLVLIAPAGGTRLEFASVRVELLELVARALKKPARRPPGAT